MSVIEIVILVLAIIMSLVGVLGTILPILPGMLLCAIPMVTLYFLYPGTISLGTLLTMLCIFVLLSVLDYLAPVFLTKWLGGSRKAMWGVTCGILVGLFFTPWGLVAGPLVGGFLGEYWSSRSVQHSVKVAAASFLSFLLTTGLNLIAALVMTYITFHAICVVVLDNL